MSILPDNLSKTISEQVDDIFLSNDKSDSVAFPIPKKAYLTGPMTGYEESNHPTFNKVAKVLRDAGIDIYNPAENYDGAQNRTRAEYMAIDIPAVCNAEAVIVLPGWSESGGSNIEILTAWYCGFPVYAYRPNCKNSLGFELELISNEPAGGLPYSTDTSDDVASGSILHIAENLINGARRSTYGHPLDDYSRVAGAATAYFGHMLKDGYKFEPEHMALIAVLMKASREINCPKRGNRVDGAGYWGVIDMIHEERARRSKLNGKATRRPNGD